MRVAQADFSLQLDAKGKVVKKQVKGQVVDIRGEQPDAEFLNKFKKDFDAVKTIYLASYWLQSELFRHTSCILWFLGLC